MPVPFTKTATVTATSLTDVGTTPTILLNGEAETITFELYNVTADSLADFALLVQPHLDSSFVTLLSGASWGSTGNSLLFVSGTLNTLATATKGYGVVKVGPVYAIKFQAKVGAAASAAITITGMGA